MADAYIGQSAVTVLTDNAGFSDQNLKKPKINKADLLGLADSNLKKPKIVKADQLGLVSVPNNFSDGFETGDTSKWNGTETTNGGAVTVLSAAAHSGSYGCRASSSGETNCVAETYEKLSATALYERAFFKLNTLLPTAGQVIMLLEFINGSNYNTIAAVGLGVNLGVSTIFLQIADGASYDYDIYNYTLQIGTWYCLELYLDVALLGSASVWLGGAQIITTSGIDTSQQGAIGQCEFGVPYSSVTSAFTLDYDDCVISSSYIGPAGAPSNFTTKAKVNKNDLLGLADSKTVKSKQVSGDMLGFLDSQAKKVKVNSADKLGFLDFTAKKVKSFKNDLLGWADSFTTHKNFLGHAYQVILTDAIGFKDTLTKKIKGSNIDKIGFSDLLTKKVRSVRSDIISFFDSTFRGKRGIKKVTLQAQKEAVTLQGENGQVDLKSDSDE